MWNDDSTVRLLAPADVLGAGSNPDDHRDRFKTADLRVPIAKDMAAEDSILKNYIENCRLEHWVEEANKWAQEKLKQEKANNQEQDEEAVPQETTAENGTT